ncbi:hypothetical protein DP73_18600 [Desulfosporosinus sp. HMP52]|uniref:hypothetical protein n=1 Tax=Desulfosporosinus sp. HMP52 TaxID=1487923 RepID=UPI00051FBB23|nr:hypothetical protein [Desulfosporosinus sp. HMP52]KGK85032.1 hypothetical protein DP73_18600 [Desulfosporosinus sp. HMP52]
MSIRGFKLFDNPNALNLRHTMGQSPVPMRGLERFMQKRGMTFPNSNYPGPNMPGEVRGQLSDLKVQEPTEKQGGIKEFLSRFTRKKS